MKKPKKKTPMFELKQMMKAEAQSIRELRLNHKYEASVNKDNHFQYPLHAKKAQYRLKHIAYCMLKGRTIEQIEKNAKRKYDEVRVKELLEGFQLFLKIRTGGFDAGIAVKDKKRLYVLVDEALPSGYAAAQASHAVAAYMAKQAEQAKRTLLGMGEIKWEWNNEMIVVLKAPYSRLSTEDNRIDFTDKDPKTTAPKGAAWREPDLENRLTAVAVLRDQRDFWYLEKL